MKYLVELTIFICCLVLQAFVTFGENQIDIRQLPGNDATKLASNVVKNYFGAHYLKERLVESNGRSNKAAASPEKVALLKGEKITKYIAAHF